MMLSDYSENERGWTVLPCYTGDQGLMAVLAKMDEDELRPGFSDIGTRNLLYTYSLSLRPRMVLEIGTHIGSGAVVIASALRANGFGHMISLEPQEVFGARAQHYLHELGVSDRVDIWKSFSYELETQTKLRASGPFDLIFIDGAHEYDAAYADIVLCYDLLQENGIIILHDVGGASFSMDAGGNGGPRRAMHSFLQSRPEAKGTFLEYPMWLNPCGAGMICKQRLNPKP